MTDRTMDSTAATDVRGLLDRIDVAWRAFLDALNDIPDDRLDEDGAVGDWSLKDLFGHVAFWDEQAVSELDRALAGLPEEDTDWQAMNDVEHVRRQGRALPEQRAEMHQAHAVLMKRLQGVAGIEAAPIDRAIKGASYEHYEEHIPDILGWRERAGI